MKLFLGIDTSNYTTSMCAIRLSDGAVIADARKLLPVHEGEHGLRQSEALFHHIQQLPVVHNHLLTQMAAATPHDSVEWCGFGVSVRPRPFASSYMPVFLAGKTFAEILAQSYRKPLVQTSHQEGHVAAAIASTGDDMLLPLYERFLAVHISGGTSDVLVAQPTIQGYRIDMLAEGNDLHAGQFVDRVGVRLGLSFPSGPHLEQLAKDASVDNASPSFRIRSSVKDMRMSFSGPCSAALRAIEEGVPSSVVAVAVQDCIANTVTKALTTAAKAFPAIRRCFVVGGVAENLAIRARIIHRLRILSPNLHVTFAGSRYSADNARGVAAITRRFVMTTPQM